MARLARIVVPGASHHVTQRANNQQDVFFVADDRRVYLEFLREQGARFGFRIDGYCLMTNHIHLIGVPAREDSLAKAVGRTHFLYTQYVNRMHGRTGRLWQNRFYSCAMDQAHAYRALCYVELNPVRAGMAKHAWEYARSSAPLHCDAAALHGSRADVGATLLNLTAWRAQMPPRQWRDTLKEIARDKPAQEAIRRNTYTGRPLGADRFLSKVEHLIGRRVRPLPIGRQKGWRKNKHEASATQRKKTNPNKGK
ncbi:MAG TPA: transposase [Candidatus Bathyarchaeia archaeon]|nr:transposase [Candidatus Bathyarchaeia archaeon]